MTILSDNLRALRGRLNCTQSAMADVLNIGFRTYVRYEAGDRDAPAAVLVKMARLGNISLDRLLTMPLTEDEFKVHDQSMPPKAINNPLVVGGSLAEGRLLFKGVRDDYLVSTDDMEKKVLGLFRKMDALTKEKCLMDLEWLLTNLKPVPKPGTRPSKPGAKKTLQAQNTARLKKQARSVKKVTLKG